MLRIFQALTLLFISLEGKTEDWISAEPVDKVQVLKSARNAGRTLPKQLGILPRPTLGLT